MNGEPIAGSVDEVHCPPTTGPKISHAMILTGTQLARGMARMFFVFVVARVLGPRLFGIYALLLALVELLAVAAGTGYADYLTREAAKDARTGWGLGEQLAWLRLAYTFSFACIALLALFVLGYPRIVILAAGWLFVSLAPRSFSETVQGVLRGVGHYIPSLIIELVYDCALAGGAIFILASGGALGKAIGTEVIAASAAGATSVVLAISFRTRERIYLGRKQLFEKSVIFNIYAFAGSLYDRLDVVLLSRLAGDYATGIYSAAYRPLGSVQLVPYGVLYSLLPSLSRNVGGSEEIRRLERAMGLLLAAAFAIVLAAMVFADPAVHLLLGPSYAESALALRILVWSVVLRFVNYGLGLQLLAGGHERLLLVTSLVCLGLNIAGNLLLIPIYSWRAAAALTVVTELAVTAQFTYCLRRTIRRIPRPLGWIGTSVVFAVLLSAWIVGARLGASLAVGGTSLLLFGAYIYQTGLLREFAAAWGSGSGNALPEGKS